ncbi:Transket-pyr domain containing protein [Lactarius tabidus]
MAHQGNCRHPSLLCHTHGLKLDVSNPRLTDEQRQTLKHNIQLLRDVIVLFTSTGAAGGVSGPYDTVPKLCILLSLFESSNKYHPIVFDQAGHRVAIQYLLPALRGHTPAAHFLQCRAAQSKLPGHPELDLTPGVKFSSGPFANCDKTVFCLGSDGSQQEGNDAEAARLAVAQRLNVKLLIDDNNYLKGYELLKTLACHGLEVITVQGEDVDALWDAFVKALAYDGPVATKRVMAPGVPDIEGSNHGHDVIPVKSALFYFKHRGYSDEMYNEIENILSNIKPSAVPHLYVGSTREKNANRVVFGEAVSDVLDGLSKEEAAKKVMVIDSDLSGSTVFVPSGVMERSSFSAAAGFGFEPDKFVYLRRLLGLMWHPPSVA